MVSLGNSWDSLLCDEFEKEYYLRLRAFLKSEYANPAFPVYPDMHDIFNALKITDYHAVKAVIIGQDPYHGPSQAHGLSFSVRDGIAPPPSLINIFKELNADLGYPIPKSGNLTKWAENGVLLLNTVLTVRGGAATSHRGKGWEQFTDRIITLLNMREEPIVFLLWGGFAKSKAALITNPNHHILTAAHPSPLSAYNGFFGCRHFSKANALLREPIDWHLEQKVR
ncbi:MAG: uracil-DNA glycosylase [Clostridia bacterium]|nr:uracil-DNA glycosylase [Clostridia bacterium]